MTEIDSDLCYVVTSLIAAPANFAFDYLADVSKVGDWALGAFNGKPTDTPKVYTGTSLYDFSPCAFAVDADRRRLLIDYLVGSSAEDLVMRITSRVIPGESTGRGAGACIASMSAWRPADFDHRRWARLKAFHDAEIHIVRDRIEKAWKTR
ncbi:MAG: hypothetical protein KIT16_19970 [Rhodospirillaceae bacterium]|nr:hypothetical protein [Rhodospirillaceae bacterium]